MIATSDEIKSLLQLSGSTYDTLIGTLIPICTDDIYRITNNRFNDDEVEIFSDGLTFAAAAKTITTDDTTDYTYLHIASGDDILIRGSLRNDGFRPVTSKTSSVITITTPFALNDETPPSGDPRTITIGKARFPAGLKLPFARMVGFHIQKNTEIMSGIKSMSLGRYSVSYGTDGYGYSEAIIGMLRPYMVMSCR